MTQTNTTWQPLASVSREETIKRSDAVLAREDIPISQKEDVFRITESDNTALNPDSRAALRDALLSRIDGEANR